MITMIIFITNLPIKMYGTIGTNGIIPSGGSPGIGGGLYTVKPAFRIGLVNEKFRKPIDFNSDIKEQITQHYINHFPNLENSIMFSPYSIYSSANDILLGWYDTASGNLHYMSSDLMDKDGRYAINKKHRPIEPSNFNSSNLFFGSLKAKLVNNRFSSLGKGNWKTLLPSIDNYTLAEDYYHALLNYELEAAKVWNYLLKDWDDTTNNPFKKIDFKLDEYTKYIDSSNPTEEQVLDNKVGYLDLLMTIYLLSSDDQKPYYETEIERFISGEEFSTRPPLIAIDTAVRLTIPAVTTKPFYLPSTSYLMFEASVTSRNDLCSPTAPAFSDNDTQEYIGDHTRRVLTNLIQNSVNEKPNIKRISDLYGEVGNSNGFNWGQSGVCQDILRTTNGIVNWYPSSVNPVMKALTFNGSHYGFVIVEIDKVLIPNATPEGGFSLSSKPTIKLLEKGAKRIGQDTDVTISSNLLDTQEDDWVKALSKDLETGFPKIKIDLKSTGLAPAQADKPATYQLETSSPFLGHGEFVSVSADELRSFILGDTDISYKHDLFDYPVDENAVYKFDYEATIQIQLSSTSEIIDLNGDPSSTSTTYKTPPNPIYKTYTSIPTNYSEIKQGSPNNETFEAMAGTPTTRSLYFASGGSEFIVDIVAEYFKDIETKRTYRSYFTGTPSEFKLGDQAGNHTVGGFSLNGHSGGSQTKTWSGSIPWTGSHSASGWHGGSVTDSWDYSAQEAALAEAEAYAAEVNGTTISHTAASDGQTRNFNSWSASVSGSKSEGSAGKWNDGKDPEPASGTPGEPGYSPAKPGVPATSSAGTAGSYSYSVTVTLPAHKLCGPEHENDMPQIEDTWQQKITYDIMKIKQVNVWKIDKSHVDGMAELTATDDIIATVQQGDPNIFSNIAASDTSQDGRIRYSVAPEQHDAVVWNEGPRSATSNGLGTNPAADDSPGGGGHSESYGKGILYTKPTHADANEKDYHVNNADAIDKATPEYQKFDERRKQPIEAMVISDFVILQTSSGDQSILYFEKSTTDVTSDVITCQDDFPDMQIEDTEMWEDNPESAFTMKPEDINIGSYNGNFSNPAMKYKGNGDGHETMTILDIDPANTIQRPARPNDLILAKKDIDVKDTIPNDEYITGKSMVFYTNILTYGGANPFYQDSFQPEFSTSGLTFEAPYSDSHRKVNDIVIHNPISAEDAMIMSLDASLDQRSAKSVKGGNLQSDITEYVTTLKEVHPYQNFIYNGDAELTSDSGQILNWRGEVDDATDVTFKRRTANDWKISGEGSFEIIVPAQSDRIAKYVCTTVGEAGVSYDFTGKIGAHRTEGYFIIEALNASGQPIGTWQTAKHTSSNVTQQNLSFTTPNDTVEIQISIVNGSSHNTTTQSEYIFADDLSLTKENGDTAPWVPMKYSTYEEINRANPDYVAPHTIPNPEYIPAINIIGANEVFNYTGNYQTYAAPYTGLYTLEAWGAQGGNYTRSGTTSTGGNGTYVKTTRQLNAGDTLYVYVGGQGIAGNSQSGGWNGGGTSGGCSCGSSSGGGATDFRTSHSVSHRFLVAGGGGGAGTPGNHGRSSISIGSSSYVGETGASSDGGGGGGGYRGGYNGGTDMGAYAGSSYVNGSEQLNSINASSYQVTTGARSGHGMARITLPPIQSPAIGEPTILVNNANYVPAVVIKINNGTANQIISPAQGVPYIEGLKPTIRTSIKADKTLSNPPDDWYKTEIITTEANPTITTGNGTTFSASDFLLLDYPFQVYFPNEGDFYRDGAYGLSRTSKYPGKGFIDNMSTTEWTAEKIVKFGFAVIHKDVLYPANTEISLEPIDEVYYDFYLPLGNKEALSAQTEFYAVANNASGIEMVDDYNNKKRFSHKNARHRAIRKYDMDVVGRIGNFIMEDTGDYRFSNFFKKPRLSYEWYIPNVVYKVATDQQREYLGTMKDIRNHTISTYTNYLNTYGTLDFLGESPKQLPLTPTLNNIASLRRQPLRIGYPIFMDIQTIGNYYHKLGIIPYYYHLNLQTGDITPVDVYIRENKEYKPINIFGNVNDEGIVQTPVNDFKINLDWEAESARRNYSTEEKNVTEFVRSEKYNIDENGNENPLLIPLGKYHTYGNVQVMYPNGRNRTFIGTSKTYGEDKNPGDVLREYEYNLQAQRWHFTFKLPSSAIFSPHGQPMNQSNIDSVMNKNSVIVAAADILASGDTYTLQYTNPTGNGSVTIAGTTHSLASIPYSVYAIYSAEKSAANDLSTSGTH